MSGFPKVALLKPCFGKIVVALAAVGIKADRLFKQPDSLVRLAFCQKLPAFFGKLK